MADIWLPRMALLHSCSIQYILLLLYLLTQFNVLHILYILVSRQENLYFEMR